MAASIAMRRVRSALIASAFSRSKVTISQRLKDGWIGKAGEYLKNILRDYKVATVDIFTDSRDRPIKAAVYFTAVCCTAVAAWNNPDEKSFDKSVLDAANDLLLLSDAVRSPQSDRHLQRLMSLRKEGRIRRLNLLVCSVMWRDDYGPALARYDAQCEHLRAGWRDFDRRVLDVGFMNRWFYLQRAMEEYDINDEAFESAKMA